MRLGRRLGRILGYRLGGVHLGGASGLLNRFKGAAAGFSLRKIGSGPAVRLRRGNGDEDDFEPNQLVSGTVGDELVVNGDFSDGTNDWTFDAGWSLGGWTGQEAEYDGSQTGVKYLRQDDTVWDGEPAGSDAQYYVMEFTINACSDFTQAGTFGGVGSLRSFSSAYGINTAGTYRILRRNVSTEGTSIARRFRFYCRDAHTLSVSNISLKTYNPSEAELFAWNGNVDGIGDVSQAGDSCTVRFWYDQSGNGIHVGQSTLTQQPYLIKGGITSLVNGLPSIDFDGDNDSLESSVDVSATQVSTHFAVAKVSEEANITAGHCIASSDTSGTRQHIVYSASSVWQIYAGTALQSSVASIAQGVYSAVFNGASSFLRIDGTQVISGDAGSQDLGNKLTIGRQLSTSSEFHGGIQEVIIYPDDQTANLASIEQNINDHYSVF